MKATIKALLDKTLIPVLDVYMVERAFPPALERLIKNARGYKSSMGVHRANRRRVLQRLGMLLSLPLTLRAQPVQVRTPKIGLLMSETVSSQALRLDALRAGLREFGYIEGDTIGFDLRSAEGNYETLPALAADLVNLRVDVIVAFGIKALAAARQATAIIPIVIPATSSDLVALGLVRSLARPGGNVTGSTTFGPEVMAKRLELVKETLPGITRVAVLVNPVNASVEATMRAMEQAASGLQVTLKTFDVAHAADISPVFASLTREQFPAVVIQDDTIFGDPNAATIAALARRYRLVTIGGSGYADAGGMLGFGRSDVELYRRGAYFVQRILKGAKPADLPIEQASRFELVINLNVADALGMKVPPPVLLRADRVIR
jgi:putative ABC transport system substrate-binding protein